MTIGDYVTRLSEAKATISPHLLTIDRTENPQNPCYVIVSTIAPLLDNLHEIPGKT